MIDLIKSNEFGFWVPMDLCKSDSKEAKESGKRWVQGIASTPDKDLQHEIVDKNGIDFSYFLEYGYLNNDHKPGFENKIGQPTEAKITKDGFWTKGFLFENHKTADAVWELAHALISSNSDRRLGFSIQGKVIKRAGNRILKCWVQDVAITAAPINTNTWLEIAKSLNAVPQDMWVPSEESMLYPEDVLKSDRAFDEAKLDLKKTEEEDEEKALTTATAGGALIPQSLDCDVKDQKWGKSMTFSDCVHLLQQERGLSRPEAVVLVDAVFTLNGINL